jgi:hypothetical protein
VLNVLNNPFLQSVPTGEKSKIFRMGSDLEMALFKHIEHVEHKSDSGIEWPNRRSEPDSGIKL